MHRHLRRLTYRDLLRSRTELANCVRDHFDMRWRSSAATADKLSASLDDASRIFSHVLRRAHVKLSAAHVARQTRVRLRRELALGERAHPFDCAEHDRRTHSAIESYYIGAPFIELGGEHLGRRAEQSIAVQLNCYLRDDRQIAQFMYCSNGLLQF